MVHAVKDLLYCEEFQVFKARVRWSQQFSLDKLKVLILLSAWVMRFLQTWGDQKVSATPVTPYCDCMTLAMYLWMTLSTNLNRPLASGRAKYWQMPRKCNYAHILISPAHLLMQREFPTLRGRRLQNTPIWTLSRWDQHQFITYVLTLEGEDATCHARPYGGGKGGSCPQEPPKHPEVGRGRLSSVPQFSWVGTTDLFESHRLVRQRRLLDWELGWGVPA